MEKIERINELKIKIFADGASKEGMVELYQRPFIKGFTTNPTLMRQAEVPDYQLFAKEILTVIKDKPISFEVFADEFKEMERQARLIASWGDNVYVKIPITNTRSEISFDLVRKLSAEGIKINVTAILTLEQVEKIIPAFSEGASGIISVFAGRIADTGRDPMPIMKKAKQLMEPYRNLELLWASPREILNIFHAEEINCDIITVTHDMLKKIEKIGYELEKFSLDTVKMFYNDGQQAGYKL